MSGEEITIKGQGVSGEVRRLDLFDGLFTTGYRLTSFEITPQNILTGEMVSARLTTQETAHQVNWDWDNNLEVGWAVWNTPIATRFGMYNRVDEDSSIVEDLFIDLSGDAGENINYIITMRKVTFPIGIGAMNMVRNMSQG
tara:strand:- start:72 stop:494 length:423 start_codon:yes stop_codon:yes gene_type:complete